jgi:hypothetical protein
LTIIILALGELDFVTEILGALDQHLRLARVLANPGKQFQRLSVLAPP